MQTFVVRVWTPASAVLPETDGLRLRGVVEHPVTGRHETFTDDDELLAFLRLHVQPTEVGGGRGEAP